MATLTVGDRKQRTEKTQNFLLLKKRYVTGIVDRDAPGLECRNILLSVVWSLLRAFQEQTTLAVVLHDPVCDKIVYRFREPGRKSVHRGRSQLPNRRVIAYYRTP